MKMIQRLLRAWREWVGVYPEPNDPPYSSRCGICREAPCNGHGHYYVPVGEL